MSLDHAILGFLALEPTSGYDLKTRCFDKSSAHAWTADQAQIYRTLDRLEQRRLVSASVRRQKSRPDRKVYSITRAGLEALGEWLAAAHPLNPLRDPFLVQLMHSAHIDDESLLGVLRRTRDSHQKRLDTLRTDATGIAAHQTLPTRAAALRRMSIDGAIARERATIDWLDDCIDLIATGLGDPPPPTDSLQRQLFVMAE